LIGIKLCFLKFHEKGVGDHVVEDMWQVSAEFLQIDLLEVMVTGSSGRGWPSLRSLKE